MLASWLRRKLLVFRKFGCGKCETPPFVSASLFLKKFVAQLTYKRGMIKKDAIWTHFVFQARFQISWNLVNAQVATNHNQSSHTSSNVLTPWLAADLVEAAAGTDTAGYDDQNADDCTRNRGADGYGTGTAINTFQKSIWSHEMNNSKVVAIEKLYYRGQVV